MIEKQPRGSHVLQDRATVSPILRENMIAISTFLLGHSDQNVSFDLCVLALYIFNSNISACLILVYVHLL